MTSYPGLITKKKQIRDIIRSWCHIVWFGLNSSFYHCHVCPFIIMCASNYQYFHIISATNYLCSYYHQIIGSCAYYFMRDLQQMKTPSKYTDVCLFCASTQNHGKCLWLYIKCVANELTSLSKYCKWSPTNITTLLIIYGSQTPIKPITTPIADIARH